MQIDKIVCLVIDNRYNEWLIRQQKFKELGLEIENFICGNGLNKNLKYDLIDNQNIKIENFWKHNPCKPDLIFKKREYWAAFAHQAILKNCVEKKLQNLLILEDDTIPTQHFQKIYPQLLQKLDNLKWDTIYFGSHFGYKRNKPKNDIDFLKKVCCNIYGWHGVLLNYNFIKELSEIKLEKPFDNYCNSVRSNHNFYYVYPQIITEE